MSTREKCHFIGYSLLDLKQHEPVKQAWNALLDSIRGREEVKSGVATRPIGMWANWYQVLAEVQEAVGHKPTEAEIYAHPLSANLKKSKLNLQTTSLFNPIIAEFCLHGYSNPGDSVVDPWAGGEH